jgi:hypothetical protein
MLVYLYGGGTVYQYTLISHVIIISFPQFKAPFRSLYHHLPTHFFFQQNGTTLFTTQHLYYFPVRTTRKKHTLIITFINTNILFLSSPLLLKLIQERRFLYRY